ncbi:MAG: transglycosylase SLT domain-containing protein, partial [Asticcacaulis sp.]|uniref:lytic transglycosylase domain-containing protein n=1 Tax=Asticcacaulis sp. TaxID=1872648 RepID=UPI003F7BD339
MTSKRFAPRSVRARFGLINAAALSLALMTAAPAMATAHKTATHKTATHKTSTASKSTKSTHGAKAVRTSAHTDKSSAKKIPVATKHGKSDTAALKTALKAEGKKSVKPVKTSAQVSGKKLLATDSFAADGMDALTRALAAVPKTFLPEKSTAASDHTTTEAPVVMNAAPVPYRLIATSAPVSAKPYVAPLSDQDASLYQAAFTLIDQGRYDDAEAQLAQVSDKSLMGYAEYHKLFSRGYTSTYDELIAWLNTYGDQPMAMNVWNLAKRKKPDGAPDPAFPSLNGAPPLTAATGADSAAVALSAKVSLTDSTPHIGAPDGDDAAPELDSPLTPKSARSAYNNGDLEGAVKLGRQIGDHWVAGLALWRLKRFDQALTEFKFVATDPSRNSWSQSSGAYWAGRCALQLKDQDDAQSWFKIAASFPFTFYGLVAEARLGVTPAVELAKKGLPPSFNVDSRDALKASLSGNFAWALSDPRARRLDALVQIGRTDDAQDELKSAIQHAGGAADRDNWLALAAKTHVPFNQLTTSDWLFDASSYPMPDYGPSSGLKVDKALLFAFARKESKFNPKAYSYAGAYGLLQLMPSTAALVENDSSYAKRPKKLLDPDVNLKVGQDYINRLQDSSIVSGDLLRTIAAYNAGPRPVKDALDSLGDGSDSLLVMESIPVAQTRQYVEEVAASYWIYRQLMNQQTPTLAMAASDSPVIAVGKDEGPAAPI